MMRHISLFVVSMVALLLTACGGDEPKRLVSMPVYQVLEQVEVPFNDNSTILPPPANGASVVVCNSINDVLSTQTTDLLKLVPDYLTIDFTRFSLVVTRFEVPKYSKWVNISYGLECERLDKHTRIYTMNVTIDYPKIGSSEISIGDYVLQHAFTTAKIEDGSKISVNKFMNWATTN